MPTTNARRTYRTWAEAIDARKPGEEAIFIDGKTRVVRKEHARGLAAQGRQFAYLYRASAQDKRVVTIPVNED